MLILNTTIALVNTFIMSCNTHLFFVVRTVKVYSSSRFQVPDTKLLTISTMLYTRSPRGTALNLFCLSLLLCSALSSFTLPGRREAVKERTEELRAAETLLSSQNLPVGSCSLSWICFDILVVVTYSPRVSMVSDLNRSQSTSSDWWIKYQS